MNYRVTATPSLIERAYRKIKAVFEAKGQSGKPLCTTPPYGYLKDPEDKNHWIVDEEAAGVMREIFRLCVNGYGPSQIANELIKRNLPTPSEYFLSLGIKITAEKSEIKGIWQQKLSLICLKIKNILDIQSISKQERRNRTSARKIMEFQRELANFKNTHEAIIDQETFAIIQRIRDDRQVRANLGEIPVLSRMLFCADCGNKLY